MSYNIPEQRLDPPEMRRDQEDAVERAFKLLEKIEKLHDKAESFFEELTPHKLEDIFADADYTFQELEDLYNEYEIVEDEYRTARWMVDEIEGWYNEKWETIKHEDK